jgi:putative hydrolase of the HAD superfamily
MAAMLTSERMIAVNDRKTARNLMLDFHFRIGIRKEPKTNRGYHSFSGKAIISRPAMDIKAIAFDADDTLWVNEPYYQEAEEKFRALMKGYAPGRAISEELLKTETLNLALYGYGIKGFTLSMIETALRVSSHAPDKALVERTLKIGRELYQKPIEILEGVEDVLKALQGRFRLVVATKGDLLDQERKLKKSGLEHFFHHIEIMSDKQESDYLKLIRHLDIQPAEFLMIGNSLKSDVLPVLAIGGHTVHVPYHTTWAHEHVARDVEHDNFRHVEKITDLLTLLDGN